ncbi:MAG: hypothetical protein H0T73_13685, partial [Ardenticatenales bacterium]|nr:hypothetical protein [Ardenticatenales bacterium]
MKARSFIALLLLLLMLPVTGHAQEAEDVSSPQVATFEVEPAELAGFEQAERTLRLTDAEGTLLSTSYAPGWEFIAVAATWQTELPHDAKPFLEVRVSDDGKSWSEWSELPVVDADRPDHAPATFTELLFVQGSEVQLRASLQNPGGESLAWEGLRLTVIDGRPGPSAEDLMARNPAAVHAEPTIISRAQWGANESYRFTNGGAEVWPREYATPRALFVHHTATSPSAPDPAAAMRSIY